MFSAMTFAENSFSIPCGNYATQERVSNGGFEWLVPTLVPSAFIFLAWTLPEDKWSPVDRDASAPMYWSNG